MIEVRPTVTVSQLSTVPASSQGAVKAQTTANSSPVVAEKTVEQVPVKDVKKEPVDSEKLATAVSSINEYVQSVKRDIQFSVDGDLDTTVVKVVDSDSGELIRQIPGEVFLEMARKLKEYGEFRLVDATG